MPVYNLTIDDTSPLVVYDQWWSDSSHADSFWSDYANGTFHATDQYGATATLTFNGSAVYLYGAKRPNHDVYAVTLDGNTVTGKGQADDPGANQFNATLFSQTGLDTRKPHTLTLQNKYTTTSPSWVDVDYIVVTTGDGVKKTQSQDTVWDDGNAGIVYSPGWDSTPNDYSSYYYEQTMHRTNTANASASVIFTGNAISVYGCTSTNHGLFSVSLDGAKPQVFNGTAPVGRYQLLLYYAGGLSNDQHNLTLTNLDTTGLFFDLDKVVLSSWPGFDAATSSTTSPPASSSHAASGSDSKPAAHHTSTGAIVGGVLAGTALGGAFVLWRRRARRGLDRITRAPADKRASILPDTDGEPFTLIEPFTAAGPFPRDPGSANASRVDVSERSPLALGASKYAAVRAESPVPTSVYTGLGAMSEAGGGGSGAASEAGSKWILPRSPPPDENPHRDFPPPDYAQATAALGAVPGSARPLPLPGSQSGSAAPGGSAYGGDVKS